MSQKLRIEAILDHVPKSAESILDVGCAFWDGESRQRVPLHDAIVSRTDARVVGIDVIEDEIELMREQGYEVSVHDAQDMNLDETFDVIVAGEVVNHFVNPGRFFARIPDHLAPGGRLLVTTRNPGAFSYFRRAFFDVPENPPSTCWIGPENIGRMAREATDGRLEVTKLTFIQPGGGISGLLWRAGRKRASGDRYIAVLERTGNEG